MKNTPDYSSMSSKELQKLEREIAEKHLGKFPFLAVFWSIANFVTFLALWPLVLFGIIPLWLGFCIATVCVTISYLPSHEAQHDIIAKPGTKLRWLNELVGWIGSIPLVIPYPVLKYTHLEHHKHTNNPDLDPDYYVHADTPLQSIWKGIQSRQPRTKGAQNDSYGTTLVRIKKEGLITVSALMVLGFYTLLITLAWSGFAIEAALLIWLPRHLGLSYITFFLAWAPHTGLETGRYKDTRSWRSIVGNIGSLGMQFHLIHHLYPRIPLYRTPLAYWEMKPILEQRKCELGKL